MAKVTGIGGLFFRATDPEALQSWYAKHLGLPAGPMPWMQEGGPTVFAPFERGSDYFPDQFLHMINLRVDDLTGLIAQLEAAGIAVETREEWDGDGTYGTFARVHDPEGNPIELWQPPAALPAAPEGDAPA